MNLAHISSDWGLVPCNSTEDELIKDQQYQIVIVLSFKFSTIVQILGGMKMAGLAKAICLAVGVSGVATFTAATLSKLIVPAAQAAEQSATLSDKELDLIFGRDRPAKIGPHPLVYMTQDEARQVKGKNPMAIAVIRGGIGAAIGAGGAYMNGGDGRSMAIGAVAGFAGGFWGSFGSAAAGGGYAGAFAGGLAGGYGSLGSIGGCNSCHQTKR
ncbi:hypothetical protein [Rhodopseudomonas sp.]|uniref:hypothetical protein n=1 Tax=Rhodopseudomonas sp. TaxID=1078 RepID=UPI0039E57BFB